MRRMTDGRVELDREEYTRLASRAAEVKRIEAKTAETVHETAEKQKEVERIEAELKVLRPQAEDAERKLAAQRLDWRRSRAIEAGDRLVQEHRILREHRRQTIDHLAGLDDDAFNERVAVLNGLPKLPEGVPVEDGKLENDDQRIHQRALEVVRKTGATYEQARKAVIDAEGG
jgi:hypothetical protein